MPTPDDHSHPFANDRPIACMAEDILDRADIARNLADSVAEWREDSSLVLSITGPWGSGKTSIANMLADALRARSFPSNRIIQFSPWLISDTTQISRAFFSAVESSFNSDVDKKNLTKLGLSWAEYAHYICMGSAAALSVTRLLIVPLLIAGTLTAIFAPWLSGVWIVIVKILGVVALAFGAVLSLSQSIAHHLAQALHLRLERNRRSLDEVRGDLIRSMSSMNTPLVVIIDDIDRLRPPEQRMIFQIVHSCAPLPKLAFVLVFQKDVVASSLASFDGAQHFDGHSYLEKLITMDVTVPPTERAQLDHALHQELEHVIGRPKEEELCRFVNMYNGGLDHYISSLRNVKRVASSLRFFYSATAGSHGLFYNWMDLVALETIRIFEPQLHAAIYEHSSLFLELDYDNPHRDRESRRAELDRILGMGALRPTDALLQVLTEVFPGIEAAYGGSQYDSSSADRWYRERRACSPDLLPRYFLYCLPPGSIGHDDLERVLEIANDREALTQHLRSIADRGLMRPFLDNFEVYKQQVPLVYHQTFVAAFLDIGDSLPDQGEFDWISPQMRATRIIHWYLKQCAETEERGHMLVRGAMESSGILLIAGFASEYDSRADDDYQRHEHLIDPASADVLKSLALERIRRRAVDGSLVEINRLGYVLFRWHEWTKSSELEAWITATVQTRKGLLAIALAFLSPIETHMIGDKSSRIVWHFDIDGLAKLCDPEVLAPHMDQLDRACLAEREEIAVVQFAAQIAKRRAGRQTGKEY